MAINENGVQVERQYIGARYVPKFFQGVNGSPEWVAGLAYEALTIVTYLGNSFTSKVPVPAGIGNPADNPTYWVNTGNYNAQVEAYRVEVSGIREELNNVSSQVNTNSEFIQHIGFITTPEMFGAIGDGTTDDTEAFNKAIQNGYVLCDPKKTYAISIQPNEYYAIKMTSNSILNLNGCTLKLLPNNLTLYAAVLIENINNCRIFNGTITGDIASHMGEEGEYGSCIRIQGSSNVLIQNMVCKDAWGDGVYVGAYQNSIQDSDNSKNVSMFNVQATNNRRCGIAITGGIEIVMDNIYVNKNGVYKGISPKCGIDIEPNHNITVTASIGKVVANDNGDYGVCIANVYSTKVNVEIDSIVSNNTPILWSFGRNGTEVVSVIKINNLVLDINKEIQAYINQSSTLNILNASIDCSHNTLTNYILFSSREQGLINNTRILNLSIKASNNFAALFNTPPSNCYIGSLTFSKTGNPTSFVIPFDIKIGAIVSEVYEATTSGQIPPFTKLIILNGTASINAQLRLSGTPSGVTMAVLNNSSIEQQISVIDNATGFLTPTGERKNTFMVESNKMYSLTKINDAIVIK